MKIFKNKQKFSAGFVVLIAVIAAIIGAAVTGIIAMQPKNQNEVIKDFYTTENFVSVSPHDLRLKMDKGDTDFILVDVRTKPDYETAHVAGAINIPVTGNESIIVSAFKSLPKDKEIITYCYSAACMASRKVGLILAENGIFAKHLNIGWIEWRYYWTLWNTESEWNTTNVMDYIATGSEPGIPKKQNSTACPITGPFGC